MLVRGQRNDVLVRMDADCIRLVLSAIWYSSERSSVKDTIIKELQTVYDPEMPSINVYDLGLIYEINISNTHVDIVHTLTSMLCPAGDLISSNIKEAVERVNGVETVTVKLTHTPQFSKEMMSEDARLTLGI